ncbi:MAG: PKD domain-containing protein [Chryseolinea sp.]
MKKQLKTLSQNIALIVLLAASFSLFTFHTYGQQTPRVTPGGRGYLEYLPPGYASTTDLYPTIIFLHGSGERGDGTASQIMRVAAGGTPKFIKNGATMCFVVNGVNECFIVLSPQQTTDRWGWQGDVIPFVKFALATYRIDPDRVYLTGLSMGGDGTWDTSYDVNNNPNFFAAMSPISCKGDYNLAKITASYKIAVWSLHGDKDTTVPPSEGKRPINGMNSVAANPVPIFTLVAGGTHGGSTWDKTYSPTHTYYNPNIYEWFLTYKRGVITPKPPTVSAGVDKTITLPISTVSLTGTATDADGTIATKIWTQSSGPNTATIVSSSALTTNITGLIQGTYVFSLSATDNSGLSTADLVTVQVLPAPAPVPPTANAGVDKSITEPASSVVFSGSGTDSDGTIASYAWTQTSGPNTATLAGANTQNLTASGLIVGSYSFTLTVTDNTGLIGTDQVVVTVLALPPNNPPTANAGSDKSITLPTSSVSIVGSGTDSDGSVASYAWTQSSGPSTATITPPNAGSTSITALVQGVYVFTLTVTDNKGSTGVDQVTVTVLPLPPNNPPTANAGTDKTITLPINTTTVTGSGTDSDGSIASYAWVQTSGPNTATINSPASAATALNGLIEGSYVFTLTVTDDKGVQGSDQVTVFVFPIPPNQPPTANAGVDKNITLPANTVTVTGIGTDSDGTIASFSWIQQSGPSASTLTTPTQTSTQINNLIEGVYTFEFKVTDNKGATGSDLVIITVFPAANIPPTAVAGGDKNITLPTSSVSFTGSGTDSDGTISSYLWEQVSGPSAATITGAALAAATMSNLTNGIYTFSLTVTDDDGAKSTDQVNVTVAPEPPNQPPVANAGTDKNLTLPTNSATLNGSGTDSDGTITSYLWNFISGPGSGNSSALDQPTLNLTNLVIGIYVFELVVTDNRGASSTDEVKIFVDALNQPPVANAGTDKTITLPVNSVLIIGSGSDSDGTISSYVWEQISGPNTATFDTPLTSQVTASGLVQGIYTFSLRVTDDDGVVDTDQVTVLVNPVPPNAPPIASVGPDLEITLPTNSVSITGSGTDSDGTIASYKWSRVSGPNTPTSTSVTQPSITYSGLIAGSYVFRLAVTDNLGAIGQKDVKVKVNPQPANIPPVANAGSDQQITLPVNLVTLSGTGTDSDGTITQYQWLQVNGPSIATFSASSSASTQAQNLVEGIYVFRLVVTDNKTVSTFDEVAVTVKPIPFNLPPLANAGGNIVITLPTTTTTLTGSGTDTDGTIAGYNWSQISGPSTATTSSVTQPSVNLSALVVGIYVFRLTVTDDKGSTGFDEINIRVQPVPANQPPTADAGLNKIITLPASSTTFTGSGTDPDGTIATLAWTQTSGPTTAALTGQATPTLSASTLIEGTYIFRLTVTDNSGVQGFDEVNVRVNPEPPNTPPKALAGNDITITLPTSSTTITGSGTDTDGTISGYAWTQTSGPSTATLGGATSAVLTPSGLVVGVYIFKLTVTDDDAATGFDEVQVIVDPLPNNNPPVADAGTDKSVIAPPNTTSLVGTATDSDGTIATTVWSQTSGPNTSTITNGNSLTPSVSNLVAGTYIFSLLITDNKGASDSDEITVNVSSNLSPTAFAGDPIEVVLPDSDTLLTGGGSDPDGTITQYNWTQISGASATTSALNQPTLMVSGLALGSYVFRLTVTDNNGDTNFDDVQIDVRTATINLPPVASAGPDSPLILPVNSIQLQGSATDTDGSIVSFAWVQISGPSSSTISDNTASDPLVSDLIEGAYVFELTVTDNAGATDTDQVQIDVITQPNLPPVAEVGSDSTLVLPVNSIQLQGSGTDPDGTIASYSWVQISGPGTASISDATIPNPIVSDLIEGVYVFELTVTDNNNESSTAQVTITLMPFQIENVVFPKVFTPNGKNGNDTWTWTNTAIFDGCELTIFNHFGKKVFGMTSYDNSWDGTSNGVPLEAEAYYFIIKCGDGQQTSGGVRIVR